MDGVLHDETVKGRTRSQSQRLLSVSFGVSLTRSGKENLNASPDRRGRPQRPERLTSERHMGLVFLYGQYARVEAFSNAEMLAGSSSCPSSLHKGLFLPNRGREREYCHRRKASYRTAKRHSAPHNIALHTAYCIGYRIGPRIRNNLL